MGLKQTKLTWNRSRRRARSTGTSCHVPEVWHRSAFPCTSCTGRSGSDHRFCTKHQVRLQPSLQAWDVWRRSQFQQRHPLLRVQSPLVPRPMKIVRISRTPSILSPSRIFPRLKPKWELLKEKLFPLIWSRRHSNPLLTDFILRLSQWNC